MRAAGCHDRLLERGIKGVSVGYDTAAGKSWIGIKDWVYGPVVGIGIVYLCLLLLLLFNVPGLGQEGAGGGDGRRHYGRICNGVEAFLHERRGNDWSELRAVVVSWADSG